MAKTTYKKHSKQLTIDDCARIAASTIDAVLWHEVIFVTQEGVEP